MCLNYGRSISFEEWKLKEKYSFWNHLLMGMGTPGAYIDFNYQFVGHAHRDRLQGLLNCGIQEDGERGNSEKYLCNFLKEYKEHYNFHIRYNLNDRKLLYELLDVLLQRFWRKFNVLVDLQESDMLNVTISCIGYNLATEIGNFIVSVFGTVLPGPFNPVFGWIHIKGPVYYSGGRVFWCSYDKYERGVFIKGPKYQLFDEIQSFINKSEYSKVLRRERSLSFIWDKTTNYGLYNGQAELDI